MDLPYRCEILTSSARDTNKLKAKLFVVKKYLRKSIKVKKYTEQVSASQKATVEKLKDPAVVKNFALKMIKLAEYLDKD